MKWEDFRASDNIEDRRGEDEGSGFSLPMGGGGGGLGLGTIIVLGLLGYALGIDPRLLIGGAELIAHRAAPQTQQVQSAPRAQTQASAPSDQIGRFVAAVLAENEDVWSDILPAQKGIKFVAPKLVMFDGTTQSACGTAQSAMGPFYCPGDRKIYLDTSFFNDMKRRFGGGGDFAYAYVIAHEMGHHIENQLGILPKVHAAQQQATNQAQANALSVKLELMADCLAGVWAANADQKWNILENGDVEKAIATAPAIGDDRLQQAANRRVVPDSFTHGSASQRTQWLKIGLESGQINSCNTFSK